MAANELVPATKPLPPQRWGFLPTNEFWNIAARNPVGVAVYIAGITIFLTAIMFWFPALTWWQLGIASAVFCDLWFGLFERWIRRRAARPRRPAISARRDVR